MARVDVFFAAFTLPGLPSAELAACRGVSASVGEISASREVRFLFTIIRLPDLLAHPVPQLTHLASGFAIRLVLCDAEPSPLRVLVDVPKHNMHRANESQH